MNESRYCNDLKIMRVGFYLYKQGRKSKEISGSLIYFSLVQSWTWACGVNTTIIQDCVECSYSFGLVVPSKSNPRTQK